MVRFLAILLLIASPALAGDSPLQSGKDASGPDALRLTGPTEAPAGQPIAVVVHGLPAVDMSESIGEQTAWIETIRFAISSPDDAEIELDKELSMTVAPWGWRLRVTFTPPADGIYVLVCDWNQSPYGLALHRMQIGPRPPPVPPVPPGPDPPTPPPVTTGAATIMVLRHMDQLNVDQAEVLIDLRAWSDQQPASRVRHLEFSPDADDDRVQYWVQQMPDSASLPYWFLTRNSPDGVTVTLKQGPLPDNYQIITGYVDEVLQ